MASQPGQGTREPGEVRGKELVGVPGEGYSRAGTKHLGRRSVQGVPQGMGDQKVGLVLF